MRRELIHDGDGVRDLLYVDMADLHAVRDHCHDLRAAGQTGPKDMPHLAEFPAAVVEKYINDNGITFAEWMANPVHVRRMLNDPALAGFRVDDRKVGRAVE